MITYRRETWAQFHPDCLPLLRMHHDELDPDAGFAPDIARSKAAVDGNVAQVVTARDGNRLVGYCIFYVAPNLEDNGTLAAWQGPWFIDPDNRGGTVAYRLFKAAVDELAAVGVKRAFPHHWLVGDSPKAGRIFEAMGAKKIEEVYVMDIPARSA